MADFFDTSGYGSYNLDLPSSAYDTTDYGVYSGSVDPLGASYGPGADTTTGFNWAGLGSGLAGLGTSIAAGLTASNAAERASAQQAAQYQQALALQQQQFKAQQQAFAPYQQIGYQGLGKLYGNDIVYQDPATGQNIYMKGSGTPYDIFTDPVTGQKISYDAMVTNKLGADAYTQSPEYQAQNALAQKALSNQRQARGLEFSAPASAAAQSAELSQKLTAQDYGQYKADLINRYNALRNQASSQYDVLTQQANLGLGATKQLSSAGQNYANQAGAQMGNIGTAQAAGTATSGANTANMWSGIGQAATNLYNTGQTSGWWG